jgi:hypothetical protein
MAAVIGATMKQKVEQKASKIDPYIKIAANDEKT